MFPRVRGRDRSGTAGAGLHREEVQGHHAGGSARQACVRQHHRCSRTSGHERCGGIPNHIITIFYRNHSNHQLCLPYSDISKSSK